MTKRVKKLSAYISLLVIPFGAATGRLAYKASHVKQVSTGDATQEGDAPFRDGFYLGGLDAKDARIARPSIGRWNDLKDRASFLAGYQRGYEEVRAREIAGHRH
jgi:hypothetical protein